MSLAGVEQFQTRNELDDAYHRDRQRAQKAARARVESQMRSVNHYPDLKDVAANNWKQPPMRPEPTQGGSSGFQAENGGMTGSGTGSDIGGGSSGSATVAAVKVSRHACQSYM